MTLMEFLKNNGYNYSDIQFILLVKAYLKNRNGSRQ